MSSWNTVAQMEARIAQVQGLRTKPHRNGVIVIAIKIAQAL